MSFDITAPLAASAGVRKQSHLARVLDGAGDEALLLDGDTGDTASTDLPALGDELAEGGDILVVDDANLDRLRGGGVLRALAAARLAAVAAALASHSGCPLRNQLPVVRPDQNGVSSEKEPGVFHTSPALEEPELCCAGAPHGSS